MRLALTTFAGFAMVCALVLGLASIAGDGGSAEAAAPPCVTSGPLAGLGAAAANNARIVTAVAEQLSGTDAALVAVLAAYTESHLIALVNPAVAGSGHDTQGSGHDHDSVGIFQQRASWGTVAQRLDPAQATQMFVTHLLADPGWDSEPPWAAAQDVQRSVYDGRPRAANHGSGAYGGNYEANVALARGVVSRVDQDASGQSCGALVGGQPANTAPGSHGLPANYTVPASATPAESRVILFAIAQLAKPYVFGAAGPSAFDCSGLTLAAWAQVGVQLPHATTEQAHSGTPTTPSALVPGDLVLVAGDDGTLAAPGHVGIYIGDGLVLNAADERDGIRVQTYANFLAVGHGLSALRHIE